jgi:hypothetical protein
MIDTDNLAIKDVIALIKAAPEFKYQSSDGYLFDDDAKAAALEKFSHFYDVTNPAVMLSDARADMGKLRWLDDEEQFPEFNSVGWDLTYDCQGRVRSTLMIRDAQKNAVGGVQLQANELMALARYCFSHATLKMSPDVHAPDDHSDVSYLKEQAKEFLNDIKANCPEAIEPVIDQAAREAIVETVTVKAEREAHLGFQAELRRVEAHWAKQVVKLSKIAASKYASERDEMLDDPLTQEVITRAVTIANTHS